MLQVALLVSALLAAPASAPMLHTTPEERLGTRPAGSGLAPGDVAPDASMTNISGETVTLSSLYAKGTTLVVFYRGGWCPFCNLQLHELAKRNADFQARGVSLVAISVELPSEESKTQAQHGITFPMLSDPKLEAHSLFNVVHRPDRKEISALKGFGVDLVARSGQKHQRFAVPGVFLVSKQGVVLWSHVDEDYTTRPSADQLLHRIEASMR
jgi:peroxiredoxin